MSGYYNQIYFPVLMPIFENPYDTVVLSVPCKLMLCMSLCELLVFGNFTNLALVTSSNVTTGKGVVYNSNAFAPTPSIV